MRYGWTRWALGTLSLMLATTLPANARSISEQYQQDAVAAATAIVRPSVVAIETRFDEPKLDDDYAYWHYQYFRGPRPLYGLWGTGFIYRDPGYVITAAFLMDHAEYIRVILDDGRSYKAELVGRNDTFDVAVLEVEWGPDLEPISPPFGDSDALKLGQPIAIVGKALNSVDTFATAGIISAIRKETPSTDEPTDDFLQFDASFELSFTGAPMVDVSGDVVGMVLETVGTGINLGVPINDVVKTADKIISGDTTEVIFGAETLFWTSGLANQGAIPQMFDVDGDGEAEELDFGMFVTYITPNSPADIAGLLPGDHIVYLDDVFLEKEYHWRRFVRDLRVGQLVMVKFIRQNVETGEFELLQTQVQIREQEPEEEEEEEE